MLPSEKSTQSGLLPAPLRHFQCSTSAQLLLVCSKSSTDQLRMACVNLKKYWRVLVMERDPLEVTVTSYKFTWQATNTLDHVNQLSAKEMSYTQAWSNMIQAEFSISV